MKILANLTENQLSLFKRIKVEKNTILYYEGDMCVETCYLISGKIKISTLSIDGNEVILSIINENDFLGNALVFSSKPYYLGDVTCLEDCELMIIKKNDLLKLFSENINFLEKYFEIISNKTIKLNLQNKMLGHKKIRNRIVSFLEMNGGSYKKNISEIARLIIIPRPSVSREISRMLDDKVIEIKKDKIILK